MPPRVVEFVGFPGSGKTTLASRVTSQLRAEGYSVLDRPALDDLVFRHFSGPTRVATFGRALRHEWRTPARALALHRYAWNVRPLSAEVLRRLTLVSQRVRFIPQLERLDVDYVVLDEWILHELWLSLLGRNVLSGRPLRHLGAAIAKQWTPALLVRCGTAVRDAAERVGRRVGDSVLDGSPAPVLEAQFAAADRHRALLYESFESCPTIEVAGEVHEAASRVCAHEALGVSRRRLAC